MILVAHSFWLHDFWHPLRGLGYQFWSGIAGSFVLGGGIWVGALATLRKHNCHARWCWRIGRHPVDGTGFVVCRKHHPDDKPTVEEIHRMHHAARRADR